MAKELEKNPLVGDKTGLPIYELERELKGIFIRTLGLEVAERLIGELDAQWEKELTRANFPTKEDGTIDAEKWNALVGEQKRKADPVATIGIIDKHGFWRGVAPDTPEVRARLKKKGFEICPSGGTYTVATKQWAKKKEEMGA